MLCGQTLFLCVAAGTVKMDGPHIAVGYAVYQGEITLPARHNIGRAIETYIGPTGMHNRHEDHMQHLRLSPPQM